MYLWVSLLLMLMIIVSSIPLVVRTRSTVWRTLIVATAISLCVGIGLLWRLQHKKEPNQSVAESVIPRQVLDEGYVSSESCRSCHPKQHSSWYKTYHRTMTQVATPASVVAPFDGTRLQSRSGSYLFEQIGDTFWVEMTDPARLDASQQLGMEVSRLDDSPTVRKQVVMTTGSHHMQTYWISTGRGSGLQQVPWYYHIQEQRWIPAEDSQLAPPDTNHGVVIWNTNCIVCHSVRGRPLPQRFTGAFFSDVVELGIACEACHGPGEEHVRRHRNHLNSPGPNPDRNGDSTIVNPANLSHRASSEVCGQCHASFTPINSDDWLQHGYRFRPGQKRLAESHRMLSYENPHVTSRQFELDGFWSDGTKRIGGREYPAMIKSACFQRGEMSCLSCHSMHASNPNDQLSEVIKANQTCLNCHPAYENQIEEHTHHPSGSSGSECYNCHMPYTTYALFKTIRSHRVDSPSAANSQRTGRPNACNQCHLDRSLAWTARYLTDWFGAPAVDMDDDETAIAASALWLLKGDAAQRVVTAGSLSWKPAVSTSGRDWQPALLAQLLDDPYSAVRFVAYRSLRTFPGFENFEYDFTAPAERRSDAKQRALETWKRNSNDDPQYHEGRVLIGPDGQLLETEVRRLLNLRDDHPIVLPE